LGKPEKTNIPTSWGSKLVDISNIGNVGASLPRSSAPVKQDVPMPSLQRAKVEVSLPVDVQASFAAEIPSTPEQARYVEVQKAAAQVARNPYPISDQRFTIFKDIAGDYVTRFTSLVDGSVKYYPEKTLFEYVQILESKANGASFDAQV
jgi:hypothetical protein